MTVKAMKKFPYVSLSFLALSNQKITDKLRYPPLEKRNDSLRDLSSISENEIKLHGTAPVFVHFSTRIQNQFLS